MRASLLLAAGALLAPAALVAQSSPFSLEARTEVAVPLQDFGNVEPGTGVGFGADVFYRLVPHVAAYAGWAMHHFSFDAGPGEIDIEQTGYTLGLRYEHPFRGEGAAGAREPAWWVNAGGILGHFELEDEAGEDAGDADFGLGWEAGAGISWPLGARVALAPGVGVRMLRREIDLGLGPQDATLSYFTAGLGVVVGF